MNTCKVTPRNFTILKMEKSSISDTDSLFETYSRTEFIYYTCNLVKTLAETQPEFSFLRGMDYNYIIPMFNIN